MQCESPIHHAWWHGVTFNSGCSGTWLKKIVVVIIPLELDFNTWKIRGYDLECLGFVPKRWGKVRNKIWQNVSCVAKPYPFLSDLHIHRFSF